MLYSAIYENKNVALLLMRISKLVKEEYVCLCGMLGCWLLLWHGQANMEGLYDVYEKNKTEETRDSKAGRCKL